MKNINEQNNNVKKKFIKPAFSESDYCDDDWPTLEQVVEEGESRNDTGNERNVDCRIKISSPELLKTLLYYSVHKHHRLTGISAVSRYVTKCGYLCFERIEGIADIAKAFKCAVEGGTEEDRLGFWNEPFVIGQKLGISRYSLTCRFFPWVEAGITKWAHDLGMYATTLTIVILALGFGASTDWIPINHRKTLKGETERFLKWVDRRRSLLSP